MSLNLAVLGVPFPSASSTPSPQQDADLTAYVAAIQANGGTISNAEITAANYLITNLKSNSLWSKLTFLWSPFGSFPEGVLVPIKHPRQSVLLNVGFTSGDYNIKTGFKGNLSGYLNTQTTENDYPVNNNTHIAAMVTNLGTTASLRDVGSSSLDRFQLIINFSSSNAAYFRTYTTGSGIEGASYTPALGFYIGNRNSNAASVKLNGVDIATATRTNTEAPNTTEPITIFRASANSTNRGMSLVSMGTAFSDTEAVTYSTIVNDFQTQRAAL